MKWFDMSRDERLAELRRMLALGMSASAMGEALSIPTGRRASVIFKWAKDHGINIPRRKGGNSAAKYPPTKWNNSESFVEDWIREQDAAFVEVMKREHPERATKRAAA